MGFVYLALVILFILITHEAAHAWFMLRNGVEIEEVGIGFPVGPRVTFEVPFLPFPIVFSLVLLGAYVKPSEKGEEQLRALSYKNQALIFGAGAVVNVATGFIAVALLFGYLRYVIGVTTTFPALPVIVVSLLIATALLAFPRFVGSAIVPALGFAFLGLIFWMVAPAFIADPGYAVTHGAAVEGEVGALVGPIGIFSMLAGYTSFEGVMLVLAVLAVNIGLMNMLPLHPFDGGKIVGYWIEKLLGKVGVVVHGTVSFALVLALVIMVLIGDIGSLIGRG